MDCGSFTKEIIKVVEANSFYLIILKKIAQKAPFAKTNFRLKKFMFRFVAVPFKWIKLGRQKILKLFTQKPYQLLLT